MMKYSREGTPVLKIEVQNALNALADTDDFSRQCENSLQLL